MSGDRSGKKGLRILLVPEDGGATRSFRIGRTRLRILLGTAAVLAVVVVAMAASWWYFALQARHAAELEARVALLESREQQVYALARRLEEVEEEYDHLRGLFGTDSSQLASGVWLPPSDGGSSRSEASVDGSNRPTSWPLTRRGFVTQPLLSDATGEHRGLDIAIQSDSYIRAAGAGTVVEVGQDPDYGRFVVLDHGDGFRTLYGHASGILVDEGRPVRRNEVIALTGSTGRSTAPHLHFEILRDGEPVDPLEIVRQP